MQHARSDYLKESQDTVEEEELLCFDDDSDTEESDLAEATNRGKP